MRKSIVGLFSLALATGLVVGQASFTSAAATTAAPKATARHAGRR